jgi:hypothetical protein
MKIEDAWTFEALDMSQEIPAPKFERFERVVIRGEGPHHSKDCQGAKGTVIWLESSGMRRQPTRPDQWLYVVHLPVQNAWKSFFQWDLEPNGGFDPESAHLGKRPEISFDTVLEEDNGWVEGSYRPPGEFWKVVVFQKEDVPEIRCQPTNWKRPTRWEREITGMVIRFPRTARIGRADLLQAMSKAVGFSEWVDVRGPDSMMLR